VSESELIVSARQGDTLAWETLVRDHQDAVFRLAYLLLTDADEAQDMAQETFIRAFRALDRFDTFPSFAPPGCCESLPTWRATASGRRPAIGALCKDCSGVPGACGECRREEPSTGWKLNSSGGRTAIEPNRPASHLPAVLYGFARSRDGDSARHHARHGQITAARALNRLRVVIEREFPLLHKEPVT